MILFIFLYSSVPVNAMFTQFTPILSYNDNNNLQYWENISEYTKIFHTLIYLHIPGVRVEDEGFFVCSAFSVAGSIATKAYLEVTAMADEPPPIIDIGPANQTLPVNTLAILPCEASGKLEHSR